MVESATGTTAVPLNATDCGLLLASSVAVSVPVRVPLTVGVNVIDTVQLVRGGKEAGATGQLLF